MTDTAATSTESTAPASTTVKAKAAKPGHVSKKTAVKPVAKASKKVAKIKTEGEIPTLKEVTTRSRKKVSGVVHMTRDASFKLIDTQRAIWLAGLGALAKATKKTGVKGEKTFEALVKAGEKLEGKARGAIDSNASLLKVRIEDATRLVDSSLDTVGEAFDDRVKQALARLGYPKSGKSKK